MFPNIQDMISDFQDEFRIKSDKIFIYVYPKLIPSLKMSPTSIIVLTDNSQKNVMVYTDNMFIGSLHNPHENFLKDLKDYNLDLDNIGKYMK